MTWICKACNNENNSNTISCDKCNNYYNDNEISKGYEVIKPFTYSATNKKYDKIVNISLIPSVIILILLINVAIQEWYVHSNFGFVLSALFLNVFFFFPVIPLIIGIIGLYIAAIAFRKNNSMYKIVFSLIGNLLIILISLFFMFSRFHI